MKKFAFVNIAVVLALVLSLNGSGNFSANDSLNSGDLQNPAGNLPNITGDSSAAIENAANISQNAAEDAQKTAPPESGKIPGLKSLKSGFEIGRPDNSQVPADWFFGDFDAEEKDSSCFKCGDGAWDTNLAKISSDAPTKKHLSFATADAARYLKKIINNPARGKYVFEFYVKIAPLPAGLTTSFMFEVSGWFWQGDIWQASENWAVFFNGFGAFPDYPNERNVLVNSEDAGSGWKKITVEIDASAMGADIQKLGIYFGNADAQEGSFLLDDFSMKVEGE